MTAYQWKSGAHIKGSAQAAGEVCRKLEEEGNLTPKALVEASRPEDAPLHSMFEWDDAVAAERYREVQGGMIIRYLEVVPSGSSEPVRAFVSVAAEGGGRSYMDVTAALSSEPTRDEVLETALAELRAFERKYRSLSELSDVLAAIRKVA